MGNSSVKQHFEMAKKTGTLSLTDRKLDELPRHVATMESFLRNLDLSENKFSHLPHDIGRYTLLKQLIVNNNRLTDIPDSAGALVKLETLNASVNQISSLPASISNLSHLKQVNMSNNVLTSFPLMFCGLKHLDILNLSNNRITQIPDGVGELHVTELNCNQNQINSISEQLADCPRLKTLRLQDNRLQANAIPKRVLTDSMICVLALEGNLFSSKQMNDIDGYDKYLERYTAVKKKMF